MSSRRSGLRGSPSLNGAASGGGRHADPVPVCVPAMAVLSIAMRHDCKVSTSVQARHAMAT